jgi:two-component system sensor histidine kinase BaeS
LAWRLGTLLAIAVVGVLLVVGLVVNRVVSSGYESVLTNQQQQRLDDAAATLGDRLERRAAPLRVLNLVRRLATSLGGEVRVIGVDGTTLAAFGRVPADAAHYASPIVNDAGVEVGTLEADLPARPADRGFLPLFNLTLLLGVITSVVVIALISASVADRLTRPLRDVAAAARRLGAGETGARATGGDDRESAELAESFNAMADRLERSEALRRRAASDIAHDIATPATVLESQLQAMIDGIVPADQAGLEAARAAAASLGTIIADLDDLASAEAAPLQAAPVAIDVGELLGGIAAALDGAARTAGVRFAIDVPPGVIAVADREHLRRALTNVVSNAIRHGAGQPVEISGATADAGEAIVRVTDHGPGIAPADLPHVFERFYRADRSRAADPATGQRSGSGLGLTIARELLAASGGRIEVEATGPAGTTFAIGLRGPGRG